MLIKMGIMIHLHITPRSRATDRWLRSVLKDYRKTGEFGSVILNKPVKKEVTAE